MAFSNILLLTFSHTHTTQAMRQVIAYVKGLPKDKRKRLVPAPDFVDRALGELQAGNMDLPDALAQCLARIGGVRLSREDWALDKLDDYYRMNVRVVDADGRLLEQSRDLAALVQQFRSDTRQSISTGKGSFRLMRCVRSESRTRWMPCWFHCAVSSSTSSASSKGRSTRMQPELNVRSLRSNRLLLGVSWM